MPEQHHDECFDIFRKDSKTPVEHWIHVHFLCAVGGVIVLFFLEIFGFYVLDHYGMVHSSVQRYIVKYILAPGGINAGIIVLGYILKKRMHKLEHKAMAVSAMLTLLVFVAYTIHLQFSAIAMCFSAAIGVTIIYGSGRITTLTALLAICLKVVSDLCLVWDTTYTVKRLGDMNEVLNFIISILALLLVYGLAMAILVIERHKQQLSNQAEREKRKLMEQVMIDELTGVYNRNGLRKVFDEITKQNIRQYIIAMMDMDHFKAINDTHGHAIGDEYLRTFGQVLKQHSGSGIDVFRFGGDEFCAIFQNCTDREVVHICEQIQKEYLASEVCNRIGPMTISIGLAVYREEMQPSEMIKVADKALYKAKENRGSICLYDSVRTDRQMVAV